MNFLLIYSYIFAKQDKVILSILMINYISRILDPAGHGQSKSGHPKSLKKQSNCPVFASMPMKGAEANMYTCGQRQDRVWLSTTSTSISYMPKFSFVPVRSRRFAPPQCIFTPCFLAGHLIKQQYNNTYYDMHMVI